jgi:hypothetical protein
MAAAQAVQGGSIAALFSAVCVSPESGVRESSTANPECSGHLIHSRHLLFLRASALLAGPPTKGLVMTLQEVGGRAAAAEARAVPVSAAMAAADDSGSASADEMTCSICLQHTELEEIASISPGCGHSYCGEQPFQHTCTYLSAAVTLTIGHALFCAIAWALSPWLCSRAVKCILRWAAHRERSTCPQCKAPFDYLLTYYRLDGSLNDFPCEESVTLLKRARFFTDHMQVRQLAARHLCRLLLPWMCSQRRTCRGFEDVIYLHCRRWNRAGASCQQRTAAASGVTMSHTSRCASRDDCDFDRHQTLVVLRLLGSRCWSCTRHRLFFLAGV